MPKPIAHLLLPLVLVVAGCAGLPTAGEAPSSGSKPGAAERNPLELAYLRLVIPNQLSGFIKADDLPAANKLYASYADVIEAHAPGVASELANRNSRTFTDRLEAASRELGALDFSRNVDWMSVEDKLRKAREVLGAYGQLPALQSESRWSDQAKDTKGRLSSAETAARTAVERAFLAYAHADQPLFFTQPGIRSMFSLAEREQIVRSGSQPLINALKSAQGAPLARLGEAYVPYLPAAEKAAVREAILQRELERRPGLSLGNALATERLLNQLGGGKSLFKVVRIGDADGVLTLDGGPVRAQLGAGATDRLLRQPTVDDARYLLLVDKGAVTRYTRLSQPRVETERCQVGVRTLDNPAIPQAVEALREAQANLARAEAQHQSAENQVRQFQGQNLGNTGVLMATMVLGTSMNELVNARSRVEAASAELEKTPRRIEEPIFRNVPVVRSNREEVSQFEVNTYWVDSQGKSFRKVTVVQVNRRTDPGASSTTAIPSNAELTTSSLDQRLQSSAPMALPGLARTLMADRKASEARAAAQMAEAARENRAVMLELTRANASIQPPAGSAERR